MSEEMQREVEMITVDTPEENLAEDIQEEPKGEPSPKTRGPVSLVGMLVFMILAMVVLLLANNLRRNEAKDAESQGNENLSIAAIRAEVEAGMADLERQRMAMNLTTPDTRSEPINAIADRLKADAETITQLAYYFEKLLGERDAELAARDAEIQRLVNRVKELGGE